MAPSNVVLRVRLRGETPVVLPTHGTFPSPIHFKSALRSAARFAGNVPTALIGGSVAIQSAAITGEESALPGACSIGATVVSFQRRQIEDWTADLVLTINEAMLSRQQLVALFKWAGSVVGVGMMRPSLSGMFGMFRVTAMEEV